MMFFNKGKKTHKTAADLELQFSYKGHSYFKHTDPFSISVDRHGKIQEYVGYMSAGMSASELKRLIAELKVCFDDMVVSRASKKGAGDPFIRGAAIVGQIELRQELIVHADLIYNFLAVHYIREDEPSEKFNEVIQMEKANDFREMAYDPETADFFLTIPELLKLSGVANLSTSELMQYMNDSEKEIQRLKKWTDLLISMRESERKGKTFQTNS